MIPDDLPSYADGEYPVLPDIHPMTCIYDGHKAEVIYTDRYWNPVLRANAEQMVVTYYGGGQTVYRVPDA